MPKTKDLIELIRPKQYVKNIFLFLPLFFGRQYTDPAMLWNSFLGFIGFCFATALVYIFNDLQDIEEDMKHPIKKNRPLASGRITRPQALIYLLVLAVAFLAMVIIFLSVQYLLIAIIYLVLNIAYSLRIKHIAILDVVTVAIGFVLRIFAGAATIDIQPSHWLILMTFLIALFLSLAKRRDDLILAGEGYEGRKSLDGYNLTFVDASMMIMAAVTIVCISNTPFQKKLLNSINQITYI